jgi:hypothetical protein
VVIRSFYILGTIDSSGFPLGIFTVYLQYHTIMKGVLIESQGAAWKVVDDLPVPEVGDDQILVRSIWTAINPV